MSAPVRFRVKGTGIYVNPQASSAYESTGFGRRAIAMRAPNYGPNSAIRFAGPQLRDQSREADRKNGYFRAMADRVTTNLIGTGIVPQPPSEKARRLWAEWTDYADSQGQLDFYGLQALALRGAVVGGETFTRLRNRRPSDIPAVPLQLQVLEADYVPLDREEAVRGGYVQQGIAFDLIGRRTGYLMYRQHPADQPILANYDPVPVLVPASEVVHLYDAMARPGQIRGEPWLTRALVKLKELDAYDDAELVRKKISALLVGFIQRDLPQGITEADLKEEWGSDSEIDDDGVGQIVMEPGTMNQLAPGEKVEFSQPQDVGGQYEVFMRTQLRALAAFAGILYEQLTGDYGNLNDRTWRAAFNEFKRRCEMLQHHVVVFQFCRPIWRRWAQLAVSSGMLTEAEAPAVVKWIPQAWPYINPKQDIEAAQLEIRAGLASRDEKASERGRNVADIDREQAADNKRADQLELKFDSDGRNPAKGGGQPAGKEDEPAQGSGKEEE
jgi:lambda family phage portal protein